MLYPLRFREILRNYGFGNRWIVEAYQKQGLPQDHRIAETWEVCDRPNESSVVANGPLAGATLHALIDQHGAALLGTDVVNRCGLRFPLLIKFLDASNPLGEQVHQSDELAARRGLQDPGKTEGWYMLHAREGATIRCGQADDNLTHRSARQALLDGTIREQMRQYQVRPGDAFLLYAGTMHYSAGRVLFYEIMQNSDVIIGLRQPDPALPQAEREARADAAIEGIHLEPGFDVKIAPVVLREGDNQRTFAFACTHFCLERLDLTAPYLLNCDGQRFYVLSQIEGASTVICGECRETLRSGQTSLLPATLGPVIIEPSGPCALLKSYLPDLAQDVIQPLRQAGVSDQVIAGLGGQTKLNPLVPILAQTPR
jgi:mannose-6-phosphate isomerase